MPSAAPAARPAKAMTTDVSAALATLQLHPEDSQALKALAAIHPGNGAGIDAEVLSKALSDARRFHRERGDYELVTSLIDLELAWTTEAARRADLLHEKGRLLSDELLRDEAGVTCVREALDAVARTRRRHRVAGADVAGARELGADLEAVPAAGRGGEGSGARVQPLRLGGRVPPQVPPGRRRGRDLPAPQPGAGSAQPPLGQPLRARAAREGQQRGAADAVRGSAPIAPPTATSARWRRSRPPSCATR